MSKPDGMVKSSLRISDIYFAVPSWLSCLILICFITMQTENTLKQKNSVKYYD